MLLFLISPAAMKAQRQRIHTNGLWADYITNTELGRRYMLITEMELHTKQWASRWAEQVFDIGLARKFAEKWRAASGMVLFRSAQYLDSFFFKNEWRLWQEASLSLHGEKLHFNQRLRMEERWLQEVSNGKKLNSYEYITRMRYRSEIQKPLHDGKITPVLGNELMVNPGYWNSNRFIDQNRTWLGINFSITYTTTVQTHYLKIFQWRNNNTLEDRNVFRLNIIQHFNRKS